VRRVLAAVALIAAVAAVLLWIRLERSQARYQEAEKRAREAESKLAAIGDPRVFLSEDDLNTLRSMGLTDPVSQIRSDLESQGARIPIPGVLGGRMGFYDRDGVILLPGRYVYAPAEDGHIAVHTVLRYDVKPGGAIRWKLLDASPDE